MAIVNVTGQGFSVYAAAPVAVGPSSAAETTLIDQTIPAGSLAVLGGFDFSVGGTILNNTAANATFVFRVYAGGSAVYASTSGNVASSANERAVWVHGRFSNLNATNSNRVSGDIFIGNANVPTTGVSDFTNATILSAYATDAFVVDTTAAWHFKITWQLSSSNANLSSSFGPVVLRTF